MRFGWIGIFVACASQAIAATNDVRYVVTDLSVIGYTAGDLTGINKLGHITGRVFGPPGYQFTGFLYDGVSTQSTGGLPGGLYSWGYAINDLDQVAGYGFTAPFLYTNGQISALPIHGAAYGINNLTQMVGDHQGKAFVSSGGPGGGTVTDLPLLPGYPLALAKAINDSGVVVGYGYFQETFAEAFIWDPVNGMRSLGPRGNGNTIANAINNAGHITGIGPNGSFLYRDGAWLDWSSVSGGRFAVGTDINSFDAIVGYGIGSDPTTVHALLYEDNAIHDLNDLVDPTKTFGMTFRLGLGINDAGQIIGSATDGRPFLLTPIPEPSGLAAFGLACVALLRPRR